jgi:CubicO group peptidase (beta-lactamase class C family)
MIDLDPDSIRRAFAENFASRGEIGASISIWQDGREVLTLADGFCERDGARPWNADTPSLIWSATKGMAAACVLRALAAAGVTLDTPVATLWPEFAQAGKDAITIAEVLSHRAGLPALDAKVSVLDYDAVIAALAAQAPLWPRGEGHGYHTRTFGFLADEILRRVQPAGMTLGRYWRAHFAEPLGLDAWIGLPDAQQARVATTYAARVSANSNTAPDPLYRALADPGSLTRRSFASPGGLPSVSSMNTPEARRAELPASGGIASARALAGFYASLASGGATDAMKTPLVNGPDLVLCTETAFSAGFMLDPLDASGRKSRRMLGPSLTAFGHPGAGGVHAFADPENGLAFAYVMNQMELGVFPNRKSLDIVDAIYAQR